MVGYITVAHGGAQRLSEKWRHFVVHCLYSLFCTSPRCVGVPGGGQIRVWPTATGWLPALVLGDNQAGRKKIERFLSRLTLIRNYLHHARLT